MKSIRKGLPEITINQVLSNPFSRICSFLIESISNDISKREGYDINQNNNHLLSKDENLIQEIISIQSNLIDCMTSIDNSYLFMKRFYGKAYFEKQGIDISSYSIYHSDMLYYKIATIKDLYFKMVNSLCELNLTQKNCTWKNLKKMKETINNPRFFQLIKDNYECFFQIIEYRRNKSAHEGIINHKAFKAIELNINITRAVSGLSIPPPDSLKDMLITPGSFLDYRLKESRKSFIVEMYICRYNIFAITKEIFSSFLNCLVDTLSSNTKKKYSKAINDAIQSL